MTGPASAKRCRRWASINFTERARRARRDRSFGACRLRRLRGGGAARRRADLRPHRTRPVPRGARHRRAGGEACTAQQSEAPSIAAAVDRLVKPEQMGTLVQGAGDPAAARADAAGILNHARPHRRQSFRHARDRAWLLRAPGRRVGRASTRRSIADPVRTTTRANVDRKSPPRLGRLAGGSAAKLVTLYQIHCAARA